jgi:hypothetical protein
VEETDFKKGAFYHSEAVEETDFKKIFLPFRCSGRN